MLQLHRCVLCIVMTKCVHQSQCGMNESQCDMYRTQCITMHFDKMINTCSLMSLGLLMPCELGLLVVCLSTHLTLELLLWYSSRKEGELSRCDFRPYFPEKSLPQCGHGGDLPWTCDFLCSLRWPLVL